MIVYNVNPKMDRLTLARFIGRKQYTDKCDLYRDVSTHFNLPINEIKKDAKYISRCLIPNNVEKALSVKQPAASLLCAGWKDVENRSWALKNKDIFWIYIHSSKTPYTRKEIEASTCRGNARERWLNSEGPNGVICGMVAVWGYTTLEESSSEWATGPICWQVIKSVEFKNPVPTKGALGLWKVPRALLKETDK